MLKDPGRFYPIFHLRRLELAYQMIGQSGRNALDVGCGQGFLKSLGLTKAVGTDIEMTPGVVVRASAEDLPFRDEIFDLVFAGEVLEHLDYPSLALDEWVRVLCSGGKLVVSTPNGVLVHLEGNRPDHKHVFSAADLKRSLEKRGIAIVSIKAVGLGLISGRFLFRVIPVKFLKMAFLRIPVPSFLSYDLFLSGVKAVSADGPE